MVGSHFVHHLPNWWSLVPWWQIIGRHVEIRRHVIAGCHGAMGSWPQFSHSDIAPGCHVSLSRVKEVQTLQVGAFSGQGGASLVQ